MNENLNQVQGEDTSHATDKPMQENTNLEQNSVSEDTTISAPVDDTANQTETPQSENEVSKSGVEPTEQTVLESDTEKTETIVSESDTKTKETIVSESDTKKTESTVPESVPEQIESIATEIDTEKIEPTISKSDTDRVEPTASKSDVEKSEPVTPKPEVSKAKKDSIDSASVDDTLESDDVELEAGDEDEEEQETEDISSLSKTELLEKLTYIVENKPVGKVNQIVEDIRARYNEIVEEECEKEKKEFISQGNDEVDFIPSEDSLKEQFYNLVENYKYKLKDFKEQVEKERDENLLKKQEIIKAIENLVNSEESLNKTFNDFHKLQEEWRSIGLVPQSATKHLYETYHHHVERFYDFIKINKELRDLDFKKNLEQKLELCEKAELLIVEPSIVKAFKQLQEYHKQWREIGPVSRDKKEELWDRFKGAQLK